MSNNDALVRAIAKFDELKGIYDRLDADYGDFGSLCQRSDRALDRLNRDLIYFAVDATEIIRDHRLKQAEKEAAATKS